MSVLNIIKQQLSLNVKNIVGWKTKRKIVVFSVDDYGNVRLDSKAARNNLDKAGLTIHTHFDAFDALETKQDLELLFDALSSVKDTNGNPAVFTPFAVPCNIDFEKMADTNFETYYYELLPDTYSKLKGYEGTWDLWKEGMTKGLLVPQFHGREHLNLKIFEEKLANKDAELLTALKNRSYTSISSSGYPTISVTAAFEFWEFKENERFKNIIEDGLNAFEKVFGFRSTHFNPPGGREHPVIHQYLKDCGIRYIDTGFIKKEHQGLGKYKTAVNYTGKRNHLQQLYMVRNVVFEPTDTERNDWVDFTLAQVAAAFRWNKPAVISSHRVNFCGHIEETNRQKGIDALQQLLKKMTARWPDIEFMAASQLCDIIEQETS